MSRLPRQARRDRPCSHRKCWVLANGAYLWCYACGAIRLLAWGERLKHSRWIKPTGPDGENPWKLTT